VTLESRLLSVCIVAGLIGTACPAHAQEAYGLRPALADDATTDEPVVAPPSQLTIVPEIEAPPPKRRAIPLNPYAAQGVNLGGIVLYPSLQGDSVYSSNAAAATSGQQSAIGMHLRPALRFESDWVRHSWQGAASGDFTTYLKKDVPNQKDLDLSSSFRLDIRRSTHAEFDASYVLSQTGAEDSELPSTAIGNRTEHDLTASTAIIHDFGPLTAGLMLALDRQLYDDVKLSGGGKEDNGDRNNYTPSLGLRLAYTEPPTLKPFAGVTYAPRFHDQKLDRNGLARDSQGLTTSLGIAVDQGPIWSGEAAIVYAVRNYKDASLANNAAFGINGNIMWNPTDLTSVVVTMTTDLNETSSATSSGSITRTGGVAVTHALRDNVNLLGGLGLSLETYPTGTDKTITSRLGIEWQLNPDMAWTASYDGTWFNGRAPGDNYNEQRVSTGIVLRR
jgi:hypothetical protein